MTGAMEILRRTIQLGESNLCLYKEDDLRPREGKAMGRPELEQTMCCCIVPRPSEEALLLTLLSKGGN